MGGNGGSAAAAERMMARAAARAEGGSGRATPLWPTGMTGKDDFGLRSVSIARNSSSVASTSSDGDMMARTCGGESRKATLLLGDPGLLPGCGLSGS